MDQHVEPYADSTHNRYRSLRQWSGWVSSSGSAIRDQGTEKERPRRGTKKTGAVVIPETGWNLTSPIPGRNGHD